MIKFIAGQLKHNVLTILPFVLIFITSEVLATVPTTRITVNVTVVEPTCEIPSGDETISLEFDSVDIKDLYSGTSTAHKPFYIHLICDDLTQAETVKATFSGVESERLPGFLSLDSDSSASGVAIGLTSNGSQLKLDEESSSYTVVSGDNELEFGAYLAPEPSAVRKKTITAGEYSATATFSLEYP